MYYDKNYKEKHKGKRRTCGKSRVGKVIEHGAYSCGKTALCFSEKHCAEKTDGVSGFKHGGAGGGRNRSYFKKICRNKNKGGKNADFRKVTDGKFFHKALAPFLNYRYIIDGEAKLRKFLRQEEKILCFGKTVAKSGVAKAAFFCF